LMKLDRGVDDPLPRFVLLLGTALELVGAGHDTDDTACTAKLDTPSTHDVAFFNRET
jgi:hypothetical protein